MGRLDDADALAEVLGGVFTLVHLVDGVDHPDEAACGREPPLLVRPCTQHERRGCAGS